MEETMDRIWSYSSDSKPLRIKAYLDRFGNVTISTNSQVRILGEDDNGIVTIQCLVTPKNKAE